MKPTPNSLTDRPLLAFGAHPDDIEFGCGGVIVGETRAGRPAHLVVCSRGEAATHGQPEQRTKECESAAGIMGATFEFVQLDGDAHLEIRTSHILILAEVIRRVRPEIVLAPSIVGNQHPDHSRLGQLVRDAARLARYGGVAELKALPPHSIASLFFYSLSLEAEPKDISPILVDVSTPEIFGHLEVLYGGTPVPDQRTGLRRDAVRTRPAARVERRRGARDSFVSVRPAYRKLAGTGEPRSQAVLRWRRLGL